MQGIMHHCNTGKNEWKINARKKYKMKNYKNSGGADSV